MEKQIALEFLLSSGLSKDPSSILIKPVIGETNAPPGHERSFQSDAMIRNNDTTLFVFFVHSSEPADLESVAENLQSVERILFGPYQINVPDHTATSRIILVFDSPVVQTAFESFLLQKGYAFEFPLLLTNTDRKITQYPKEKPLFQRLKDRLLNFGKRAFEY